MQQALAATPPHHSCMDHVWIMYGVGLKELQASLHAASRGTLDPDGA